MLYLLMISIAIAVSQTLENEINPDSVAEEVIEDESVEINVTVGASMIMLPSTRMSVFLYNLGVVLTR